MPVVVPMVVTMLVLVRHRVRIRRADVEVQPAQALAADLGRLQRALARDQRAAERAQVVEAEARIAEVERRGQEHVAGHSAERFDQERLHAA